MAATSLAGLSASVTRILSLTGFPKELKTKDIQSAFSEWDNVNGGYKIKWRDDTSLLIVFQDASIGEYHCPLYNMIDSPHLVFLAKRAYLQALAFPPSIFTSSEGISAVVRPYDGPDAQTVIQTVNSRGQHASNPSRHNNRAASISVFPSRPSQNGSISISSTPSFRNNSQNGAIPEYANVREPSPTLPNIPSHPTLNSLISSSLGDNNNNSNQVPPPSDPAIVSSSLNPEATGFVNGPRIGDPGKRMLGAALGVRHPALGPRSVSGGSNGPGGMSDMQRPMGGLVGVAE